MATMTRGERDQLRGMIENSFIGESDVIQSATPNWEQEVREKARKMAVGVLGIAAQLTEVKKIDDEIEKLEEKKKAVQGKMAARMPKKKHGRHGGCPVSMDVCEAINELAEKTLDAAEKKHPTGKKMGVIQRKRARKLKLLMECCTREDVAGSKCLDW